MDFIFDFFCEWLLKPVTGYQADGEHWLYSEASDDNDVRKE